MFKLAIRGGQQGLAYLMLDNSYSMMEAMQDAMDEAKFQLVLTLLSKNPDDQVVQSVNKKGQNLMHILCMNCSKCNYEHLDRIYTQLMKRGVNCRAIDSLGRSALHYAVQADHAEMVGRLIAEKYDVNVVDNEGHTPFSIAVNGLRIKRYFHNYNKLNQA